MATFDDIRWCTLKALELLRELRLDELEALLKRRAEVLEQIAAITVEQMHLIAQMDRQFLEEVGALLEQLKGELMELRSARELLGAYRLTMASVPAFVDRAV